MKSSAILKAVYKDCIDRGYVAVGDQLYPPGHPVLSFQIKKSAKKRAKNIAKTGWINDERNIRNKEAKKDMFIKLVETELNLEIWPEFHFSVERAYRFDYAIPVSNLIPRNSGELKIAIECEGGIWAKGNSGHSSGTGIQRDMDKNNLALAQGWVIIRRTPQDLCTMATIELIKSVLINKLNR